MSDKCFVTVFFNAAFSVCNVMTVLIVCVYWVMMWLFVY